MVLLYSVYSCVSELSWCCCIRCTAVCLSCHGVVVFGVQLCVLSCHGVVVFGVQLCVLSCHGVVVLNVQLILVVVNGDVKVLCKFIQSYTVVTSRMTCLTSLHA